MASSTTDIPTTLEDALERLRLANKRCDDLLASIAEERLAAKELRKQIAALASLPTPQPSHRQSLTLLGEGSFGQIFHVPTQSVAFKACFTADTEAATQLEHEFRLCKAMSSAAGYRPGGGSNARSSSSFLVPRPWSLWRPATSEVLDSDSTTPRVVPRPGASRDDPPPSMWASFATPTFALDVVPALALPYAETFLSLFVAAELHAQCGVRLLRLYLGRDDFPAITSTLQPGLRSDFPLDIARYDRFRAAMAPTYDLPEAATIASGMGALLAQMHWCAGINGRDVELVLGGFGVEAVQCYAFDFNQVGRCEEVEANPQCQRWLIPDALRGLDDPDANITEGTYFNANGDLVPGAKRLAMLISGQELYYPRPHQPLYAAFKTGYLACVASILDGALARIVGAAAPSWHTRITRASEAFCAEFERLDAEKLGRRRAAFGRRYEK